MIPGSEQISDLQMLVNEVEQLEADIEAEEKSIDKKRARLRSILTEDIPDMMDDLGIESMKLTGDRELSLKWEYGFRLAKKNEEEGFAWLEENGYGGLIKVYEERKIHHRTGQAWVKEMHRNGDGAAIPSLFNPFAGRIAKIS